MKTYLKLSVLMALFLAGCSSTYQTANVHDDIYYSRTNAEMAAQDAHQASAAVVQVNAASGSKPAGNYNQQYEQEYQQENYAYADEPVETETYYDEEGNVYVIQNFYMDGYHDYSYSSRIRRFHHSWAAFGYYDPFFTNMYWYNYNPHYYGTSIYMGYNLLFFPSQYYRWGHRPWGWAHYGYGWGYGHPWGSYWAGHFHGYWAGYHHGYWVGNYSHWGGYGYPYIDYNYYGQGVTTGARRPSGSSSSIGELRTDGRYGSAGTKQSVSETGRIQGREQAGIESSRTKDARTAAPAEMHESSRPQSIEAERSGQIAQRPAVETREQSGEQRRPAQYEPQRRPQDYAAPTTPQQREAQAPRYTRPEAPQERDGQSVQPGQRPRTYTSPSQQQPRSNQEYRRPASEQRPAATGRDAQAAPQVRPQGNEPARPQATPQQRPVQTRPQAAPQRTPSQTRPQAAPQRTPSQTRPQAAPQQRPSNNQRPQAAPSRSPQRSTPSNVGSSSPSRGSSGSSGVRSSSPSRSSGSSSGSSSRSSSSSNRR
ncbi:MAG: hypothetical protein EA361_07960 [Bacteroidetes bacterium]|nr:MAG: hypothetical protein EA361_07960 [Bacteroidota bacterium]